jgi:3-(3-hydroxy-phenyl)propionate hydroxylase
MVECDVLVVGLGPVGAALGALLARAGLSVIAVEKDEAIYPLPRAAHFDHEIMRLFQQLGIAEEVLRHARPAPAYEFRAADGQALLRFESGGATSSGWAAGYMFHQPGVELALREALAAAGAEIRLGSRLIGLSQDGASVTARLDGPDGESAITTRYLVGCDGGRSLVREQIGGALDDYGFDEPWLVLDVKLGESARVPAINLQLCDPARPMTCVLMGPGRHRWEFMLLPGETPEQVLADDFIASLLAPWDCGAIEIDRRAVYRFHALVAQEWRVGRVLLAGDAAHQMPPFAGQGMCSGLRDAANLAWKLAAVLGGDAGDTLLDSYQKEREPHVRSYIELAIDMGRVVCLLDPAAAAARDAGMLAERQAGRGNAALPGGPALAAGCLLAGSAGAGTIFPQPWAEQDGQRIGLDAVLGDGPWLIDATELDDVRLALFRAPLQAWLERQGATAVLVRPDRYVFGTGDAVRLTAAYAEHLNGA